MINNETRSLENKKDWKLVNFCEFDKYATKSYCAIHDVDESLNLGDITKVDETKLESFNMICGGSPCQDFSVAGKQKGSVWTCKDCGHEYNPLTVHWSKRDKCPHCNSKNIEKTRSSLLVEYLRIIRANKPDFGMYENVKNIVGKQFRDTTFKLFEDELHEYDYNTYWKVLNAKDYGIPQNRERVYLIFIKKELDNGKFVFPEGFDNGIRLKDILDSDVEEKYYLSDKMLEKMTLSLEKSGKNFIDIIGHSGSGGQKGYIHTVNGGVGALSATDYKQPKQICVPIDKSKNDPMPKKFANCIRAREDSGISNRKSEGTAILELNNINMLGLLDIKGNEQVRRVYGIDGVSPTLNTMQGGNRQPKILHNIRIRKLTPGECFRLMGFSDEDYYAAKTGSKIMAKEILAKYPHEGKRQMDEAERLSRMSNTQLYKQTGNSIVVDVLYYILVELYKAMPYLFDDLRLSSFFSGIGAFEVALDRLYEGINSGNFINPQVE